MNSMPASQFINSIIEQLRNKGDRKFSIQIAPAVRVSIGEYLGYEPGVNLIGELVTALKQIGFDYVFDTNFGADLTIMEEATELVDRVRYNRLLPMFTTCCPSWYMFVERLYPELIPYLSSVKSPQAILGSIVKTYFQEQQGIPKGKLVHMALAPCQMKKEEAKRKELWIHDDEPNIDAVITTTEMAEIFKAWPIDLHSLPKSELDNPLGLSSGAGAIFGTTGGVMEAAMRTAYYLMTGKDLENFELQDVRNTGLKHSGTFDLAGYKLNIGTVNSLAEMKPVLDEIKNTGKSSYQFIEVMNCPMGCIGGTGQWCTDREILLKRREAIFNYDKEHQYRASYQNEYVSKLYKEYFGNTDSDLAKRIMHIEYHDRSQEPAENFACKLEDNR